MATSIRQGPGVDSSDRDSFRVPFWLRWKKALVIGVAESLTIPLAEVTNAIKSTWGAQG
jgi:hypothetical protein